VHSCFDRFLACTGNFGGGKQYGLYFSGFAALYLMFNMPFLVGGSSFD